MQGSSALIRLETKVGSFLQVCIVYISFNVKCNLIANGIKKAVRKYSI